MSAAAPHARIEAAGLGYRHRLRPRAGGRRAPRQSASPDFAGIRDMDLALEAGTVLGVVGPNGAGKSTLLRLLATLLPPGTGTLRILGTDGRRADARLRRRIGYAADDGAHLEPLSAFENVTWFGRLAGLDSNAAARETAALFERLGMAPFAGVRCADCSHGSRRKLLLAAALVHRPELIVLDEPTLGLDPDAGDALLELLRERATAGAGVVVATHDLHAAQRLCDRLLFLDAGRTVLEGSPAMLLARLAGSALRVRIVLGTEWTPSIRTAGAELVHAEAGRLELLCHAGAAALPGLCAELVAQAVEIRSIELREPDLRDVFGAATGRVWDAPAEAP